MSTKISNAMEHEEYRPATVRDCFLLPKDDHQLIDELIKRTRKTLPRDPTKSEIVRMALQLAWVSSDKDILSQLNKLKTVKKGRPKTT